MDKNDLCGVRNGFIVSGICMLLLKGCDLGNKTLKDKTADAPIVKQADTNYVSNVELKTYSSNDMDSIYNMGL